MPIQDYLNITNTQSRPYIIAEVGTNHLGKLSRAIELIEKCAEAGADAVKFQSWQSDKIINQYQFNDKGQAEASPVPAILDRYQIPNDWYPRLYRVCQENEVAFLSTPFDVDNVHFLSELGVSAFKISSGDLTFKQLIQTAAAYGKPMILSTGMGNLAEIETAIDWCTETGNSDVTLLHCLGAYPPDQEDANLRAISTMAAAFGLPTGFSDHYPNNNYAMLSRTLGADVFEKHVTISRKDGAPDSPFAITIDEFKSYIKSIQAVDIMLGNGRKKCQSSEAGGLVGGRRCLYAKHDLAVGHIITSEDIKIVRPNIGDFAAIDFDLLVGRKLMQAISAGYPLMREHFEH